MRINDNNGKELYDGPAGSLILFDFYKDNVPGHDVNMEFLSTNNAESVRRVARQIIHSGTCVNFCVVDSVWFDEEHYVENIKNACIVIAEEQGMPCVYTNITNPPLLKIMLENVVKRMLSIEDDGFTSNESQSLQYYLFLNGLMVVTCNSKEEYSIFKNFLIDNNFVVSKSVNPDGYNDVCKYLYCSYCEDGIKYVSASHRMPDCADAVCDSAIITGCTNFDAHVRH